MAVIASLREAIPSQNSRLLRAGSRCLCLEQQPSQHLHFDLLGKSKCRCDEILIVLFQLGSVLYPNLLFIHFQPIPQMSFAERRFF